MFNRLAQKFVMVFCCATFVAIETNRAATTPAKVDFIRDIRPLLSDHCFACHGADSKSRKAKLRLDDRQSALEKQAFVPGKPNESELIKRIFSTDPEEQMPPPSAKRPLSEAQKQRLRNWVEGGAPYAAHWAFTPPKRAPLPQVADTRWPRNAVDFFVLKTLEAKKLSPSSQASTAILLRRVSLDLTGLPPDSSHIERWMRSGNPLDSAVDELLSSPHFGERMASDWMDVARYADTHGFNNDSARSMWRWRDWVIEAFNRNLPYNQFITMQMAGDLMPARTLDHLIATGFNRNHVISSEGGIIDEEYRVEYVADRVNTTSLAWLGLTMVCARCHDHKFDPIPQRDFYRLFAFFNSVDEHGEDGRVANAAPLMRTPTDGQQKGIADLRASLKQNEATLERLTRLFPWKTFKSRTPSVGPEQRSDRWSTNQFVTLDWASQDGTSLVISNSAGGTPVQIRGSVLRSNGPGNLQALRFDGAASLKTESLPKKDSSKGWAFSAWVKRANKNEGVLFSTADFGPPPSSGSYGQGIEIRLTASGAVDFRAIRRWPAYSVNIVTRETLSDGQWGHLLITCEGSGSANELRVFIDGEESLGEVIHDGIQGSVGLSGAAIIGASGDKQSTGFDGALADVHVFSKPFETDNLAGEVRADILRMTSASANAGQAIPVGIARQVWLEAHDAEFARLKTQWRALRSALLTLERAAPTTMVMRDLPRPRPTYVLLRGQYDQPREEITPGVPDFLLPFPKDAPRNRLGLAQWLTHPHHPLTSRVVINRFWQSLFGSGLVKSVEDFGVQSDPPSHPELLDWLAVEFVESGWDVKKMLRLLVTSSTYRQNSRSTPALNDLDPDNRFFARGPRQRLTAEMLRDQALTIGSLLNHGIGGPPAFPYQPENLYKGIVVAADYPGTTYTESKGLDGFRRSLYTFWKRTVPHPTLATFDAPDREVCVGRRLKTNTPLQALALMNDRVQLQAARNLAERMMLEGGEQERDRIVFAFQLATARRPEDFEIQQLMALLRQRLAYYRENTDAAQAFVSAGASSASARALPNPELASYANIASLILNLDETITRN